MADQIPKKAQIPPLLKLPPSKAPSPRCRRCRKIVTKWAWERYCLACYEELSAPSSCEEEPTCCVLVTLDDIDHETLIHVKRIRWNHKFNRGYCTLHCTRLNTSTSHTHWNGRLHNSPGFPYYVQSNWYRLSLRVNSLIVSEFGPHWCTLYHGTHPQNIHKILENGFWARQCQHGFPAVYLSPSIQYSAHPRYARVVEHENSFYQFVIEVRVNTRKLQPVKKRETLSVGTAGDIDPNFPNNEDLEFLFRAAKETFLKSRDGLVVTGVMVRKLDVDPATLPSSWWWCKWRTLEQLHKYFYNGMKQVDYNG